MRSLKVASLLALIVTFNLAWAGKQPTTAPDVRSGSVLVLNKKGQELYAKDADQPRPFASITKLMTVMVVLDAKLNLNEQIRISEDDIDHYKNSGSRLKPGATLSRRELIMLAIVASENRAAHALARTYPGGAEVFVSKMNEKAKSLGMTSANFADPVGLRPENSASARDLAKMAQAAYQYDLIRKASTTESMQVKPYAKGAPVKFLNTNRLVRNDRWDVMLSKTGYISEAGRCLVMTAEIRGEPTTIVLLDSFGKLTPMGDSNRIRKWLEKNPS